MACRKHGTLTAGSAGLGWHRSGFAIEGIGSGSTNLASVFGSSVEAFTAPDWANAGSSFISKAVAAKPERRRNFRRVIN
jgi:hypothetical protein